MVFYISRSTRRNDLDIYEKATAPSGPAMSLAMYSISRLDVGDIDHANELFSQSYQNYIREPFNVWSEVADVQQEGAINFITGSGGFLQAVLNGYAGIRIHLDHLEIRPPHLPPNTNVMLVKGIFYLQNRFNIKIRKDRVQLKCLQGDNTLVLIADNNESQVICHKCKC